MNYTIIGNDGKNYGPISADQLRQWIKQSRIESRTPVFVQGTTDWTFVGLLPEFAGEFSETPPVITPSAPGSPAAVVRAALVTWPSSRVLARNRIQRHGRRSHSEASCDRTAH